MTAAFPLHAFAAADTETNSKDPQQARLLEICFAVKLPHRDSDVRTTLVDPGEGVEIPADATAVNGLTIERCRAEGKPVVEVLETYLADIADAARAGLPLVIQNAPYDLTVLDREARRNGVTPLADRLDGHPLHVLDPLVLDKRCIKFRRKVSPTQGARCLKTLAAVYGLPWDDEKAHGAEYDTIQAARVTWRIGELARMDRAKLANQFLDIHDPGRRLHRNDVAAFLEVGGMTLPDLHAAQVRWYAEQTESFGQWLAEQRNEWEAKARNATSDDDKAVAAQEARELEARIDGLSYDWPLRPAPVAVSS